MIPEILQKILLQDISIPYYTILLFMVLFLTYWYFSKKKKSNYYRKKEKNFPIFMRLITVALLTSTITTGIIMMTAIDTINNPKKYDLNPEMFSHIERAAYDNYFDMEGKTNHFNPKEVETISEKIYWECGGNISCFLNHSLQFVNNNVRYKSDLEMFGHSDYHLRPIQTLAFGKADCEDFAFLLSSIIRNKWNKTYIITISDHAYTGVCRNGTLMRYEGSGGYKVEAKKSRINEVITPNGKFSKFWGCKQ